MTQEHNQRLAQILAAAAATQSKNILDLALQLTGCQPCSACGYKIPDAANACRMNRSDCPHYRQGVL